MDGRADLMAWDMYLNLGARETQSAYHEYFLSVQVEEGQAFMIDQLNFIGNFDTGWYDPFHHELGLSLEGLTISQPYYEPASEDHDEEDPVTESEDTGDVDTGDNTEEHEQDEGTNYGEGITNLDESAGTKEKSSGCSTASTASTHWLVSLLLPLAFVRKR